MHSAGPAPKMGIDVKTACKSMAILAACLGLTTMVSAQELVTYSTVGVWDVLVDPSVQNGCLINAQFEDGSDVRIGFENNGESGYLMALNDGWEGIEDGADYALTLDVDGSSYEGTGTGIHLDGLPGVDIGFDSVEFLLDIAVKRTLTLSHDGEEVMAIDLTDSFAALEEAIACQEAQE